MFSHGWLNETQSNPDGSLGRLRLQLLFYVVTLRISCFWITSMDSLCLILEAVYSFKIFVYYIITFVFGLFIISYLLIYLIFKIIYSYINFNCSVPSQLHAKSIPNRLRRWDFALLNHYFTVSAVNASTCTE